MSRVQNVFGCPHTQGMHVEITPLTSKSQSMYGLSATVTCMISAAVAKMKGMLIVGKMGLLFCIGRTCNVNIKVAIRAMVHWSTAFLPAQIADKPAVGIRGRF